MDRGSSKSAPKIAPPPAADAHPAANIQAAILDHADANERRLLVFGWIVGLMQDVARAEIAYGDLLIDVRQAGHLLARSISRWMPERSRRNSPTMDFIF